MPSKIKHPLHAHGESTCSLHLQFDNQHGCVSKSNCSLYRNKSDLPTYNLQIKKCNLRKKKKKDFPCSVN